jgi:hypothetical protein
MTFDEAMSLALSPVCAVPTTSSVLKRMKFAASELAQISSSDPAGGVIAEPLLLEPETVLVAVL